MTIQIYHRIDLLINEDRFEGAECFKSRSAAEGWIAKRPASLRYEIVEIGTDDLSVQTRGRRGPRPTNW